MADSTYLSLISLKTFKAITFLTLLILRNFPDMMTSLCRLALPGLWDSFALNGSAVIRRQRNYIQSILFQFYFAEHVANNLPFDGNLLIGYIIGVHKN